MTQLYNLLQSIINQGSQEALATLLTSLNENPGSPSKQYGCGDNTFYALRRLVGSSLAREPRIKQNSSEALSQIQQNVQNLVSLNKTAFSQFFLTSTDLKNCKVQQETQAYIQGKINVVKCLNEYLKSDQKIISHFVDLMSQHQNFQQELLESLYLLSSGSLASLKLKVTQVNATFLLKILSKKELSQQNIDLILTQAIEQYPKQSIALKHLGLGLENFVKSPQQFFKKHYLEFIDVSEQQTEQANFKKLYYILSIQRHFLSHITVTKANISNYFCIEMIIVWLEQLRVKNKHMKKLASSITINFDNDSEFSLEIIKFLHQKNIYLQNISQNHPFSELYANADPSELWQYLVELTQKQEIQEQKQEQEQSTKKEQYLSELEYLTRQKVQNLSAEQIAKTLTILIKAYQQSKKSQKLINLVWNLFHHLNIQNDKQKKNKKKIVLNTKGSLILGKIKLNDLEIQTQVQQLFTKVIKFLRIKVKSSKQNKQTSSPISIAFLNFVTSLIIYTIVYPQQSDVCAEIQFVAKDLETFLQQQQALEEGKDVLKKKRKKSQEDDPKKPIHVLIQVFISLLTKAPVFLRNAINLMFEQLVPYLETSDLDTLLDVIQKPDQQYIEQI